MDQHNQRQFSDPCPDGDIARAATARGGRSSESVSLFRKVRLPIAVVLSLAIIGAEVSCAGILEGLRRTDQPAALRELSRAQRLVDRVLQKASGPSGRSEGALTVRRSRLLQLSSALASAEAVAASDLNTEVKIQALRAYVTRTEQLAANLSVAATAPQGANAREDKPISLTPLDNATRAVAIDRGTLQQLKAQLALVDHVLSSS